MTKAEGSKPAPAELKADTKVTTGGRNPHAHHGYVNTPVYHASTLLYRTAEDYLAQNSQYHYGRRGTPTSEALEKAIQEIEGPACAAVALLPSGLAAASTALLAALKSGDHVLVTDSVYGPTRTFCDTVLARCGVTTTYYDPLIGAGIAALLQAEHPCRVHRDTGLADVRDAGHPGHRRGCAPAQRAGC
jgi:cystathionine beta-lyase